VEDMEVKLKFITPAFIGGADNKNTAEFRLPTLKGLLRFWWRAYQDGTGDLSKLRSDEATKFGSTATKSEIQLYQLGPDPQWEKSSEIPKLQLVYMGYGPIGWYVNERMNRYLRPSIKAEQAVTVGFRLRNGDKKAMSALQNSLWLLTHLGGAGSRSRRGFGSLQCTDPVGFDSLPQLEVKATTVNAFKDELEAGLQIILPKPGAGATGSTMPAYSCLGTGSAVYVWKKAFPSWKDALEGVGSDFLNWRVNRPKKQPVGTIPRGDYDLVCGTNGFMDSGKICLSPGRAAFGLPHNYLSSSRKASYKLPYRANFTWNLDGKDKRRASPLLFHVSELAADENQNIRYCVVLTFLRSQFLPDGENIVPTFPEEKLGGKVVFDKVQCDPVPPPDYQAIDDFLSSLVGDSKVELVKRI